MEDMNKVQFGCHQCRVLGCLLFPFLVLNLVNAGQGPFFKPEAKSYSMVILLIITTCYFFFNFPARSRGLSPSVYSIIPAFYRVMILLSCPIRIAFLIRPSPSLICKLFEFNIFPTQLKELNFLNVF